MVLSDLALDPPTDGLDFGHPWVREEADRIAEEGFAGFIHVEARSAGPTVVAGGTTVLALRSLIAGSRLVWDRRSQSYRPAQEVYGHVECLLDG